MQIVEVDNDYRKVGRRAYSWIIADDVSIQETAEAMSIKTDTLRRWLDGRNRLPLSRARQMAQMFGRSTDDLYEN